MTIIVIMKRGTERIRSIGKEERNSWHTIQLLTTYHANQCPDSPPET